MTKIEWTEKTWNPIVGCSIATPGCTNCYAMKMAWRLGNNPNTPQYHGLTKKVNGKAVWTGKVNLVEKALMEPLRRRKPTMYFVNSMGDLFHPSVPDKWIDRVFAVMALCPQHTFQVLTKRADRMREYTMSAAAPFRVARPAVDFLCNHKSVTNEMADTILSHGPVDWPDDISIKKWPLPNVWLGVSVEDQTRADERIPMLLDTPAAVRFVSAEPLLGPVDLGCIPVMTEDEYGEFPAFIDGLTGRATIGDLADQELDMGHWKDPGLDWVIVGGESGPNARPMHPDWARSLRDQCVEAGVPFFFKQHGEYVSISMVAGEGEHFKFPDGATVRRTGKKAAGNLLDGVEWQQMPEGSDD